MNAVITFYSRRGRTEKLALAAAVGAVQARANIRLRRLPETADEAAIAADPEWRENHARMNREYIAPREIDADWADVVILALPQGFDARDYVDSLKGKARVVRVEGHDVEAARSTGRSAASPQASA